MMKNKCMFTLKIFAFQETMEHKMVAFIDSGIAAQKILSCDMQT